MIESPAGLLVEFTDPDALVAAVRRVREAGMIQFDTFAPYPVEDLEEALGSKPSSLPGVMLAAGACGGVGGFMLQWYAARDYPIDVGGRPLLSWPAFIPVSFELFVLTAVLVGIGTFLWRAGLPRYHHPVFGAVVFQRASADRFFLWLKADDPHFDLPATRATLEALKPTSITEVPSC